MKRQIFPTASKYRHRTRREFGGETVEYIIVILAVVVIGGGLMGFGNQVSEQIGKTGNSISSWFGKANGAGDNASGGNGTGGGNNAGGENKGDENSGSQSQAPTVSVTGMDVVGERVTAKVSNLPEGATRVRGCFDLSCANGSIRGAKCRRNVKREFLFTELPKNSYPVLAKPSLNHGFTYKVCQRSISSCPLLNFLSNLFDASFALV